MLKEAFLFFLYGMLVVTTIAYAIFFVIELVRLVITGKWQSF